MKKLLLVLFSLFFVGVSTAKAENSATAYDGKYYSEQVFVTAYNNGPALNRDNVVILDGAATAGTNLGQYITSTTTSDSIFTFGVTDESIANGSLGRICLRGPHKAVSITTQPDQVTSGKIIAVSNVAGKFAPYSTSDGTAGARLGYILNSTATTDTGDATGTYWVWVNTDQHK